MIISNIGATNFLGLGSVSLDLSTYSGIVLIEGLNKDSPTSINNGAGKSSIFEIVGYGFQGTTRRGYSGDDVVNTFAKKDCHVFVEFESRGKKYRIDRYRKHSEFGSLLGFTEITEKYPVVLTKGTAKETQRLIDEIVGMSGLTFDKMLYFGQEDIKPFASLTDAELKSVFEESLGLTYLSEYAAMIREEESLTSAEFGVIVNRSKTLSDKIDSIINLIDLTEANIVSYEDGRQRNIASISSHIDSIIKSIDDAKKTDDEYISSLRAKINDFAANEEKYNSLVGLRSQLREKMTELNKSIYKSSGSLESIKKEIQRLVGEISTAGSKIGKPCDLCKKPVLEEDVAPITNALFDRKNALLNEGSVCFAELEKYNEAIMPLKDSEARLDAALSELELMRAMAQSAEKELLFKESSSVVDEYNKTIDNLKRKLEEERALVNPYIEKLQQLKDEKATVLKEAVDVANVIDAMETEIKDLGVMSLAFGNSGIKNRIFDNITPELNTQIAKLMSVLDDIEVEVSTMKVLKSGETREKFEIKVNNKNGAGSYKGNSGGEKQKINLCISMAFNMLMRNMTDNPINVLFLDEPFEALDSGSSEAAISLCKMISEGVVVFVISHNPEIKDLISNRILVEKKGGIARVVC